MSPHGLRHIACRTSQTAAYYAEFGLTPDADGWFSTVDAGRQLRILPAPTRRLLALRVGADDADDLARAAANLTRLGVPQDLRGHLEATEPVTGVRVGLDVVPRGEQQPVPATMYNGPGRLDRPNCRAPGFTRADRVRPRKLGHAVLGSTDYRVTTAFFTDGLGFKVSDRIKDVRVHALLDRPPQRAVLAAPVSFLHHTSWQVDDIDDVGRGAFAMLEGRPERHVWGSAALRGIELLLVPQGPGGNFSEYYSDMTASSTTSCGRPRT